MSTLALTGAWTTKARSKAMGVFYCTRESVKLALDASLTSRADTQVDEAIEAASRAVENATNRVFYPWTGTRHLDWPDTQFGTSYRLWLEENELISLTSLTSGNTTINPSYYNLEPDYGPPFDHIELKLSTSASFGISDSYQRDVTITGVFGYSNDEIVAGPLTASIASTSVTTLSVSAPATIGIGSVLRIDNERLLVTGRNWADSGDTVQQPMTAVNSNQSLAVSNGAAFQVGEYVLVDAEQMIVTGIAGNTLVVNRAQNGSTLATHSGTTAVYRSTQFVVQRGALGTTAATHNNAASVNVWLPPSQIRNLVRAVAIDTVLQEQSGYARSIGSGDHQRNASVTKLKELWDQVTDDYRRARLGVI